MGAVEEPSGEDGGGRGDHEAGEVLQRHKGADVAERADGLDVSEAGGSGEVNAEDGETDSGDGLRGGVAVGYEECPRGGDDHAGDEVDAVDGGETEAVAVEAIGEDAAGEHADGSGDVGQGGDEAGAAEGEVALVLQIGGEPGEVEPDGVVDASPAEHHAPDGALADEGSDGGGGSGGD